MERPTILAATLGTALAALLTGGCSSRAEEKAGPKGKDQAPVPVMMASVMVKDFPVELSTFGTVEAYSTIEVKARIGGYLTRVHFKEGDFVKEGDVLFTIDARPYQAALDQAKANLARNQALTRRARVEVKLLKDLLQASYVPQDDYDKAVAGVEALEATVEAEKAAIDNAEAQLGYCTIRSPLDGRTGKLLVNQGNLVKDNADTPMVVIAQVKPIYVSFSLPEKDLPAVRRYMDGKIEVEATIPSLPDRPMKGELTFFSNRVDIATGTILLKGTFENPDLTLWPGQYVDVRVLLTIERGVVVVPSQAVQVGQQGPYVFVVKPDRTVELRPVQVGSMLDRETVILSGLEPGEIVVTEGQLQLQPEAKIQEKAPGEKVAGS